MARLTPDNERRALELIALYPDSRSALIPILHVLQGQEGYLSEDGMAHVGELLGLTPAEVRGTASFYDMFHTEPVGRYLVAVCTNIACMLNGAYELLGHIESRLGIAPGGTTEDGMFSLEDAECLALCGNAPCLTVNWRFFGDVDPEKFDEIAEDLVAGRLDAEVPPHGVLSRVDRANGLLAAGASVHGAGGPVASLPGGTGTAGGVPAGGSGAAGSGAAGSGAAGSGGDGATAGRSASAAVELDTSRTTAAVASLDGGQGERSR